MRRTYSLSSLALKRVTLGILKYCYINHGDFVTGGNDGPQFIQTLCNALLSEYVAEPPKPRTRDLAQMFTSEIIPTVCNWDCPKGLIFIDGEWVTRKITQIPEYRSSLVKTMRFKHDQTNENVEPTVIYDGEVDDESFALARDLLPLNTLYHKALGHKKRKEKYYQVMLKTIYAVASQEPAVAQRAIAWVIINRARQDWTSRNLTELDGDTIEKVCKAFDCWKQEENMRVYQMDKFNEIDQWLPNVEKDLKGWDPNRIPEIPKG